MTKVKRPVLRYHGGKWILAPWIISFFPPHKVYAEPFSGGASVLLRKPRAPHAEFYNDLDGEVVNLFRVLQDENSAQQLAELLRVTPFARAEFELSYEECDDPVEQARRTVARSFMGYGSVGTSGANTGFRSKSLRAHTPPARVWQLYPDAIALFTERLQGVVIDNRPAGEMIEHLDEQEVLFYVDPPYLAETRNAGEVYRFEMVDQQHEELLTQLSNVSGMVVLSGYDNDLYNDMLTDWRKVEKEFYANGQSGKSKRVECLWISPNVQPLQKRLV